ncbi:hypothetical protein FHG87_012028 [Trinorchestia longiramus]|nr:hypothetical protein FHG87_012028 [Trinorchestia longiramus]
MHGAWDEYNRHNRIFRFRSGNPTKSQKLGGVFLENTTGVLEIETFLKKVKNGKARGSDKIPYEFYKHSGGSIIEMLRSLMRYGGVK